VALGTWGTLLVISQDSRNHELPPLIDGLFAQRRNILVEIWFHIMKTKRIYIKTRKTYQYR